MSDRMKAIRAQYDSASPEQQGKLMAEYRKLLPAEKERIAAEERAEAEAAEKGRKFKRIADNADAMYELLKYANNMGLGVGAGFFGKVEELVKKIETDD